LVASGVDWHLNYKLKSRQNTRRQTFVRRKMCRAGGADLRGAGASETHAGLDKSKIFWVVWELGVEVGGGSVDWELDSKRRKLYCQEAIVF
jgi:hypothetical protein